MVIYLVMMQQLTIDTKDNRHKKYTIPQTQHFGDPFRSRLLSSVRIMNEDWFEIQIQYLSREYSDELFKAAAWFEYFWYFLS